MAKPFLDASPLELQALEGREIESLAFDLFKAEQRLTRVPDGAWNDLLPEKRRQYRDRATLALRTGTLETTLPAAEQAGDALLREESLATALTPDQARHAAAVAIETWVMQVTARVGTARLE